MSFRPLTGAGEEDAVGEGGHRRQLGMPLQEEAFGAAGDVEQPPHVVGIRLRLQPTDSTTMSTGMRRTDADQRVLDPDDQLAFLLRRHRPVGHFGHATADEVHASFSSWS